MMTTEERIRARIEELKRHRDQYVVEANAHVAQVNAAIYELEQIISQPERAEPENASSGTVVS